MSIQIVKSLEKLIVDIKTEIGTNTTKANLLKQDLKDKNLLMLYRCLSDKTVLTGSYVLKILTDATWSVSDIDIYTIDKKMFDVFSMAFTYQSKKQNIEYKSTTLSCYYFKDDISNRIINLIVVNTDICIKDYIRKKFRHEML